MVTLTSVGQERAWLAGLIAAHKAGHALEQAFYLDERIFKLDMKKIFFERWQTAGHVSQIPKAGDYFLFEVAGESVIVVKGQDGQVRAFFNVCRHRGSRVCLEHEGNAKAFVCPYHAWTYGQDGKLLTAKAMPEGFEPEGYGLKACHVRVYEGVILVCMGEKAPDISEQLENFRPIFEPHGMADAKAAAVFECTVRANWKIVLENFGECYHCSHTHPEYCQVMAHAIPDSWANEHRKSEYERLCAAWEEKAKGMGHATGHVYSAERGGTAGGRIPIGEGFLTQTMDGKPAAPLMGRFKEYDGGYTTGRILPAVYLIALNDFFIIPQFLPMGPVSTKVVFTWYVRSDAVEGRDYDVEHLSHVYKVTTEQDKKIVEDNQLGVDSVSYEPGPYSVTEQGIVSFYKWYFEKLLGSEK
jgi:glycine betaine catabolism A